ncbi:MAG: hypothetical protein UR52_C0001G0085 [Candidatus Gottesmanbacteria bacterium GW2011_GWA1_34_13]|uniref:Glycosyltransferase RgtA/B/C/D-like domain-containing protein n=1 Tax=Candidatus Gottesmanbacteria bacterium GW2011_GWA1_34_13 TaxID=1618434 RepID=A0A0G0D9J5_9BACT|nr:MAG: hypothetical protein UR52_C0001G0085 [Candidatus Gottesmanbacteria bacterium GW2011_GWA1_34_13]
MFKIIKHNIVIILILITAAGLLSININKKFIGIHDWNGVWYGTIAKNNLKLGLLHTKLGSVKGTGDTQLSAGSYFTHYPVLFPLILTAGYYLMGVSEASLRITVSAFSLLSVLFIYLITKRIFDKKTAIYSAIFTIITPLFIYYGKMPVHEPVLLCLVLGTVYFYIKWFDSQKNKDFLGMSVFLVISLLITWPAYFVPFLLLCHYYLFHKQKKHLKLLLLLILIEISAFLLHLLHVYILTGSFFGGGLIEIFLSRISSDSTTQLYSLNITKYLTTEIRYFSLYFTRILLFFSGVWFFTQIYYILRFKKISYKNSIIWLFMIFGSLYLVIFKEASFLHDYLIYYLLPFFVISSAIIFIKLINFITNKYLKYIVIVLAIVIIGSDKYSYLVALIKSNQSEKAYTIGNFINNNASANDKVFIASNVYRQFYGPFITYYSNYSIINYAESLDLTTAKKYNLIVRIKSHDALDPNSKIILATNFKPNEDDNFIYYFPQ